MVTDDDELISSDQFAAEHNFKQTTPVQMRYEGRGPAYFKIGRKVYYRRSDIRAWLEQQRREPTPKRAA